MQISRSRFSPSRPADSNQRIPRDLGPSPRNSVRYEGSSLNDSWFSELGVGCSIVRQSMIGGSIKDEPVPVSTPTGLRGDITFGFYGDRSFSGVPVSPPAIYDPVHASVRANTLMFNLYYDLPQRHGLIPYVGAGIGMVFDDLKDTTFTNGSVVQPGDDRSIRDYYRPEPRDEMDEPQCARLWLWPTQ